MTRVAINRCFGGFGISDKAFEKLLERKGIAFDKVDQKVSSLFGASYYDAGYAGDENHYLSDYDFCQDRADPDLIAVIEELGKDSWGWASELAIVDIPDDVEWHIDEYDGLEHVAENHRTWS
jgi:antirestriction protein